MYQKLIIAGRLGRDAELRPAGENQIIRFSVPMSRKGRDNKEETLWVECSYFRGPGESTEVLKLLRKGAIVLVEGTPWARQYVRNDNTMGLTFECRVANIRILALAPRTEEASAAAAPSASVAVVPEESIALPSETADPSEDLPF
jgi:single-stranded DNA-binding protein